MQILRSTNILPVPVRVFSHMVSKLKNGCPDRFEGYNDHGFRGSMHMIFRWSDVEQMLKVFPDIYDKK